MKNILYVQGYVWGFKFNKLYKKEVTDYINKHNIHLIVWDGDLLNEGSFTQIIEYVNKRFPSMKFMAFKKNTSTHKFSKNYKDTDNYGNKHTGFTFVNKDYPIIHLNQKPTNEKITVIGISPTKIKNYEDITLLAYKYLVKNNMNIHIITYGQGNIVKKVLKQLKIKPNVSYDITR